MALKDNLKKIKSPPTIIAENVMDSMIKNKPKSIAGAAGDVIKKAIPKPQLRQTTERTVPPKVTPEASALPRTLPQEAPDIYAGLSPLAERFARAGIIPSLAGRSLPAGVAQELRDFNAGRRAGLSIQRRGIRTKTSSSS